MMISQAKVRAVEFYSNFTQVDNEHSDLSSSSPLSEDSDPSESQSLFNKRKRESEDQIENAKRQKVDGVKPIGLAGRLSFDSAQSFALTDELFLTALESVSELTELYWTYGFNTVTDNSMA